MSEIAKELNEKLGDLKQLKSASGFNITVESGYLRCGSVLDSSDRAEGRMRWIYHALNTREIIEAVLSKAAELCKEDIDADMKELEEIIAVIGASVMSMGGIIKNPPEHILVAEPEEKANNTEPKTGPQPKHAGGRPHKAKVEPDSQPKKKRGRPRKVVEVSPLTIGEEAKVLSLKKAKIAEPSAKIQEEAKPVTVKVPAYHEPCKTCRKTRRDGDGQYPPCKDAAFKTGTSGIETCDLWWERGM